MSLKDQVNAMRIVMGSKACHHGYELTQVVPVLYAYIAELETKLAAPAKKPEPKKAPAKKAPAKNVWKKKA